MKRIHFILILFSNLVLSQVGINTANPYTDAILDLTATDKALLLTRVSNTASIPSPTNGMIIYDISSNCVKTFENGAWTDCLSYVPIIVNCDANSFTGTYTQGISLTSLNKFSVTITNNSFFTATIPLAITDLVLSGVAGVTVVSVSSSSIVLGVGQSQLVEYTLSGTPTASGTLTGTWTKLSLNCIKNIVVNPSPIASLNCAGAVNTGTLAQGNVANNVSSTLSYTGGNGNAYNAQTITSTGVSGLVANLVAGNFALGSGSLTFTISGTPSSVGTANFLINIGGQSCTLSLTVSPPPTPLIPSNITLAQNRKYIFASVYDQDYYPFTIPTLAASINTQTADGINEAVVANYQGSITTTGIIVNIPVTATGTGTLPAFSTTITIPANLTEDNISRDLSLSWVSQAYTSSTTSIVAKIASVGGVFNAKKLDLNSGIGNDYLGVLLGAFIYPYNGLGYTTTYQVRAISGYPDKMFGLADNNNNNTTHMMLYLPIMAEDGKIWLNNNLGAYYMDINHPSFNLSKQATSATDYLAYGNLFQWGRRPDGHEFITWTSGTSGNVVYGTTTVRNDVPTNTISINSTASTFDWRINRDDSLWANESSTNNPCPRGFRLPTITELNGLMVASGITNVTTAYGSTLKFTLPGYRNPGTNPQNLQAIGSQSRYASSSPDPATTGSNVGWSRTWKFNTSTPFSVPASEPRQTGVSVRCILN